ncbi:hypothetical protein [Streptomyces sp. NPDC096311]
MLNGLQVKWLLNEDRDIIGPLHQFLDLILLPADGPDATGTSE